MGLLDFLLQIRNATWPPGIVRCIFQVVVLYSQRNKEVLRENPLGWPFLWQSTLGYFLSYIFLLAMVAAVFLRRPTSLRVSRDTEVGVPLCFELSNFVWNFMDNRNS